MHRGDDLFGVDALQVIDVVPRLAWPSWRRMTLSATAFARELDGVGVAPLMRQTRGSRLDGRKVASSLLSSVAPWLPEGGGRAVRYGQALP
jgi:hypothetical protein